MCRCLGDKQPIIWYRYGNYYYFSENGVTIIDATVDQGDTKYTWCFVDSMSAPSGLPETTYDETSQLFAIYVTSPKAARWKGLSQGRIPAVFVMNPWTLAEIEKA